jgi:hypothetical protein
VRAARAVTGSLQLGELAVEDEEPEQARSFGSTVADWRNMGC